MIIVTATISITSATVTPTNQGWDRRMIKPASAAISNAAAVNSAIRPNPCEVIIALTAQSSGVTPPVSRFRTPACRSAYAGRLQNRWPAMRKRKAIRHDEAAGTSTIVCVYSTLSYTDT
jgi:hypothetical protein